MTTPATENQNKGGGFSNGIRNGLILAVFALFTTGLTSFTWLMTKDKIQSEKEKALLRAISELVSEDRYANDPYRDCILLTDPELLGTDEPQQAWRLRDAEGNPVAVLISSVAPNGYSGNIELIVGHLATEERIAGVRVTGHRETPGLGDKIELKKSPWILQFTELDKTLYQPEDWQVKKDGGKFDAITGATITPRAVVTAIRKNIDYYQQFQQQIFSAPSNCPVGDASD